MFRKASGLVLILLLVVATSASAQSLSVTGLKLDFGAPVVGAPTSSGDQSVTVPKVSFKSETPAMRRGSTMSWRPLVLGGVNLHGGAGFAVGGGVQASNLAGREEFGLQIDGLWSNVGGDFCDDDNFFTDCSASQISIGGSFIYWFNEMTNGWRPFAGGGIVYSRFSFDFETDDDFCFDDFFGVDLCDFDTSGSSTGIQIQGGLAKGNLQLEGRVHAAGGGAFMLLVGYKFGGGN
jgi:hypothetical protein